MIERNDTENAEQSILRVKGIKNHGRFETTSLNRTSICFTIPDTNDRLKTKLTIVTR